MIRPILIYATILVSLVACGASSTGSAIPECSDFVDGQPVPASSLTESDDGGPGASCTDPDTNSLVLSAVWDCDDGSSFVGRDDGYYLSGEGIWRAATDDDPGRQQAFWETCKGN